METYMIIPLKVLLPVFRVLKFTKIIDNAVCN